MPTLVSTGQITISDVTDGLNARLSSESHLVPTETDGSDGDYSGCSTTISVFLGKTDDSENWTVVASPTAGITGSLTGKTYTVTDMTTDAGYVDLTASRVGYTSLTSRFSITKAKRGQAGPAITIVASGQGFTFRDNVAYPAEQIMSFTVVRQNAFGPVQFYASEGATLTTDQGQLLLSNYTIGVHGTGEGETCYLDLAGFGDNQQVTITAVVGELTATKTIVRLDSSTAEAGATVGAIWGQNVVNQPSFTDFLDTFDGDASLWYNYAGSGVVSVVDIADGLSGGRAMRVGDYSGNDQAWLIHTQNIPFDPDATYRVKFRVRQLSGTGQTFLGLAGIAADGVSRVNILGNNDHGNQHYIAAAAAVVTSEWTEFVGFVQGTAANGTGSARPLITNPAKMHVNTRYIRPLILVNYPSVPGIVEVDYARIELLTDSVNWDTVTGAGKDTLITTANNASTAATTANNLLADIASDSKITASEKINVKREWDILVAEKSGINTQAAAFGITTENTAYNTAYDTLNSYLAPLLSSMTTTSDITGSILRTNFSNLYSVRQALLNKIAEVASTRSNWTSVSGKPTDEQIMNVLVPQGVYNKVPFPYAGRSQYIPCYIDNSQNLAAWFKIAEIKLHNGYQACSFVGTISWGQTSRRFTYRADLKLNFVTGGVASTITNAIYSYAGDNPSGVLKIRRSQDANGAWTIGFYASLLPWGGLLMDGSWYLLNTSDSWIDDLQYQGDAIAGDPGLTDVPAVANYTLGATRNDIVYSATAPSSPVSGTLWMDTSVTPNALKIYESSVWRVAANNSTEVGGTGVNHCNPRYVAFNESSLPPVYGGNGTAVQDPTVGYYGSKSLKLTATALDNYFYLGTTGYDYNILIQPGKKWIISAFVRSDVASKGCTLWLRTNDAANTHYNTSGYTSAAAGEWTRISGVLDLTANTTATKAIIRVDNEAGAGNSMWFDGLMLEPMVGNTTEPSPFVAPPNFLDMYTGALDATRNVHRGDWANATAYTKGDTVLSGGYGWSCILNHTSASGTNQPPTYPTTSNTWWTLAAVKGEDAKVASLTTSSFVFKVAQDGTVSPSSIALTAVGQNLTGSPTFTVTSGTAVLTGTGEARVLTAASLTSDQATIKITWDGKEDFVTITKVREGANGLTVVMTNESHTMPAASDGTVSVYTGSGSKIQVYEGGTALTASASATTAAFRVGAITQSPASTITVGAVSYSGTEATIANHSAMAAGTDSVTLTIPVTIYRADGTSTTVNKVQTITKAKAGSNAAYVAVTGPQSFVYNAGTATPLTSSITLSASLYGGLTTYDWEYWNGSAWANLSGTQNTSSYALAHDNAAWGSSKSLRVRCLSGTAFDEITIVKLYNGAAGEPGLNLLKKSVFSEDLSKGDWSSGTVVPVSGEAGVSALDGVTHAMRLTMRDNYAAQSVFGVKPGQIVYVAAWINTQATTRPVNIGFRTRLGGVDQNSWPAAATLTAGNDWTYVKGQYVVPVTGVDGLTPFIQINAMDTFGAPLVHGLYWGFTNPSAKDAYTVVMSNEAHTVACDSAGTPLANELGSAGRAKTDVRVWRGTTELSAVTASPTVGQFDIVSIVATGCTATIEDANTVRLDTLTADVGSVKLSISVEGLVTVDKLFTFSKAKEGQQGVDGQDAIVAILSNEAHVFPATSDGTVSSYAGSGTTISVYEGATALAYDGVGTSNGTWKVTTAVSNITAGTLTDSGSYLTVGNHSAVAAGTDISTVTYTITGKNSSGASFSLTKQQSFTKSKAGTIGVDGAQGPAVRVTGSRATTFTATDGALDASQSDIVFTASVSGVTSPTYVWSFSGFQTAPTNSGTDTQTITAAQFGTAKSATVTCTVSGTYVDKVTIVRLEKSTAAAGATVGATWGTNVGGQPSDSQIFNSKANANKNLLRSFATWTTGAPNWLYSSPQSVDGYELIIPSGSSYNPWTSHAISLLQGYYVTISFMAMGNGRTLVADLFPDTLPESHFALTADWSLYTATWFINHADATNCVLRLFAADGASQIQIREVKLEYGSERTMWVPHEKDVVGTGNPITNANASTYIANAAIGSAQIGSLALVGNFSVKSGLTGQRVEMDANGGRVYDANNVLRVRWGIW